MGSEAVRTSPSPAGRGLRMRHEQRWRHLLLEAGELRVARHADDLDGHVAVRAVDEVKSPADCRPLTNTWSAIVSLMTATRGRPCVSAADRSRPATSGMPTVSRKFQRTTWMDTSFGRPGPSGCTGSSHSFLAMSGISDIVEDSTPGTASMAVMIRSYSSNVRDALSPCRAGLIRNTSMLSALKPTSTLLKLWRVRTRSPAPTRSTRLIATCAVRSALVAIPRVMRPFCAPAFSDGARSARLPSARARPRTARR